MRTQAHIHTLTRTERMRHTQQTMLWYIVLWQSTTQYIHELRAPPSQPTMQGLMRLPEHFSHQHRVLLDKTHACMQMLLLPLHSAEEAQAASVPCWLGQHRARLVVRRPVSTSTARSALPHNPSLNPFLPHRLQTTPALMRTALQVHAHYVACVASSAAASNPMCL